MKQKASAKDRYTYIQAATSQNKEKNCTPTIHNELKREKNPILNMCLGGCRIT